jgi:AdoMet-dependent heme synthase
MPGRNRRVFHFSSRRGLSLWILAGLGRRSKKAAFADIWQNSVVFNELRDTKNLQGKCGCCEFRNVCMGCRARAYAATGNYLDEEPFCVHQPQAKGLKKEMRH